MMAELLSSNLLERIRKTRRRYSRFLVESLAFIEKTN